MHLKKLIRASSAHILACSALFASASALAQEVPLETFGRLPQISDASMSSSGKHLALVITSNGTSKIITLDEVMKPIANWSVGDVKVRYIDWMGDEMLAITYSQTEELPFSFVGDKEEAWRVLIAKTDNSSPPQLIFGNKRDYLNSIFGSYGVRSVDGRWIGYFGGIKLKQKGGEGFVWDHGRPHLMAVDILKNEPTIAAYPAGEGHYRDWLVAPDGSVAAIFDIDASGNWVITDGRNRKITSGSQPRGRSHLVAIGKNGDTIIFANEDNDFTRWYEVSMTGGEPAQVLADEDIDRIYRAPYDGRIVGFSGDNGSRTVFFDPALQARADKLRASFPGKIVSIAQFSKGMDKVIVHVNGAKDAGTWFLVDMALGKMVRVGMDYPGLSPDKIASVQTIDYKAADGLALDGILTLPVGREAKNLPVVMLPHGGPSSHDTESFDWWAQAIASRGYAVFQPNFRGSTNRDQAFQRAGFGEWGRKMQTDISDGLAELAKRGIVDPKRACIVGASYGGYAALAGVTVQQDLYRCAVSVAGVSDVAMLYADETFHGFAGSASKASLRDQLGDPSKLKSVSPRLLADRADAPILLIHGKDDTVVPFNYSTKMADALRKAGKPHDLVTLDGEDHGLSREPTRIAMLEAMMSFLQKHNPAN